MEFNLQVGKTYRHKTWDIGDTLTINAETDDSVVVAVYRQDLAIGFTNTYLKEKFDGYWIPVIDFKAELEEL